MGLTPLEGLVMAKRSGSVDRGLLLALMRKGCRADQIASILLEQSGIKVLSDISGNMQDILAGAFARDDGGAMALAVFKHRLLTLIGSMGASLHGVKVLALTGGIGEHDAFQQKLRVQLEWLIDLEIPVIPANEEGVIARLRRRSRSQYKSASVG